jgi:hypothetical protein
MTEPTIEIIDEPYIDAEELIESETEIEDDFEVYEEIIILDLRTLAAAELALF